MLFTLGSPFSYSPFSSLITPHSEFWSFFFCCSQAALGSVFFLSIVSLTVSCWVPLWNVWSSHSPTCTSLNPYPHSLLLLSRKQVIFRAPLMGLKILSPQCAKDFQGGNRLFLLCPFTSVHFLPHFLSETLSKKHPEQANFHFFHHTSTHSLTNITTIITLLQQPLWHISCCCCLSC